MRLKKGHRKVDCYKKTSALLFKSTHTARETSVKKDRDTAQPALSVLSLSYFPDNGTSGALAVF